MITNEQIKNLCSRLRLYALPRLLESEAHLAQEFKTMGYLSQLYIQMGETAKARELLEKMAAMEPHLTSTFLTLANVCFIQEDYQAMEEAANKAIAIEEGNAVAHYLLYESPSLPLPKGR